MYEVIGVLETGAAFGLVCDGIEEARGVAECWRRSDPRIKRVYIRDHTGEEMD